MYYINKKMKIIYYSLLLNILHIPTKILFLFKKLKLRIYNHSKNSFPLNSFLCFFQKKKNFIFLNNKLTSLEYF